MSFEPVFFNSEASHFIGLDINLTFLTLHTKTVEDRVGVAVRNGKRHKRLFEK